uniref:F-box domain-containing protein n=1 Tax=Panagrolaimus sp. ES5 TaxID=591445 RepID=A0AC34G3G2_9BILA
MKALYSEIKSVENDSEKWFKLLLEANDDDFVKNNVEYRLGTNLHDIKLWKLYIEFLKKQSDHKLLLKVYSKYCRFFLDDFEMLKLYQDEMSNYGSVNLCWTQLLDFEVLNGNTEDYDNVSVDKNEEYQSYETPAIPLDKKLFSNFFDTYFVQVFSLPKPLVLYVLDHANHRLLRNLFNSCKFFFDKKSTPICYRLEESTSIKSYFDQETLMLKDVENLELFLNKTHVTTSIECPYKQSMNFISNIIPRLSKCEAKYLNLCGQNVTFKELKFLIQHGGVLRLSITHGEIKEEKNELVDYVKIMEYLPNVKKLALPLVKYYANSTNDLMAQKRNKKFSRFYLSICGEPFDPHEFRKFIIENRDKKLDVCLRFDISFDPDFVQNMREIMEDYERSCEKTRIVVRSE